MGDGALGADTVVVRRHAYAHSTMLTWTLMAIGMDIVELALWSGERHNEDGWKILSSLCWDDRTPGQ